MKAYNYALMVGLFSASMSYAQSSNSINVIIEPAFLECPYCHKPYLADKTTRSFKSHEFIRIPIPKTSSSYETCYENLIGAYNRINNIHSKEESNALTFINILQRITTGKLIKGE